MKRDIRALTKTELRDFFVSEGDKAFRGNQVYEWLWSKSAHSFEDMTNISLETREMLEENFVINHIKVDHMQRSSDGTVKNAVRLRNCDEDATLWTLRQHCRSGVSGVAFRQSSNGGHHDRCVSHDLHAG